MAATTKPDCKILNTIVINIINVLILKMNEISNCNFSNNKNSVGKRKTISIIHNIDDYINNNNNRM